MGNGQGLGGSPEGSGGGGGGGDGESDGGDGHGIEGSTASPIGKGGKLENRGGGAGVGGKGRGRKALGLPPRKRKRVGESPPPLEYTSFYMNGFNNNNNNTINGDDPNNDPPPFTPFDPDDPNSVLTLNPANKKPLTDKNGIPLNRRPRLGGLVKQSWSVVVDNMGMEDGDGGSGSGSGSVNGIGNGAPEGSGNEDQGKDGSSKDEVETGKPVRQPKEGLRKGKGRRWHVVAYYAQVNDDSRISPFTVEASLIPAVLSIFLVLLP